MTAWSYDSSRPVDIISMGRVAVDLYSEQIGCELEHTETFRKYLGGCAGNIAVGCARLGLRSAMFSCVGADAMGRFLQQELQREQVDTSLLKSSSRHLTGLVLLGITPPDHFPLMFYRENCADMQLQPQDVDAAFFRKAKSLLITGTGLSTASMNTVSHHAVDTAKSAGARVIFDLDYRPVLWGLTDQGDGETRYKSSEIVSRHYQAMLPKCDLLVGTEEEILIAGNAETLQQALRNMRESSTAAIVVKHGAKGCSVYLDDMAHAVTAPAFPVRVLNVLGAGDGFISGFLRGLLRGETWQTCAAFGNACGAIVVTRHGCAPAMPYFSEMQQFMQGYEHERQHHEAAI